MKCDCGEDLQLRISQCTDHLCCGIPHKILCKGNSHVLFVTYDQDELQDKWNDMVAEWAASRNKVDTVTYNAEDKI